MLDSLPISVLLHALEFLAIDHAAKVALLKKELYDDLVVRIGWSPRRVDFTFDVRFRIRKLIFDTPNGRALPSHFTHMFLTPAIGPILRHMFIEPPYYLEHLHHERSAKNMKLHHPYFYRQLPLALDPLNPISSDLLSPEDIPLPHDLSMTDIMFLMLLNRGSLRTLHIDLFDTTPLPWNSTPSRVCPRDIIGHCRLTNYSTDESAKEIWIWCPDCQPAQLDHAKCWKEAGQILLKHLKAAESSLPSTTIAPGTNGATQRPSFHNSRATTTNARPSTAPLLRALRGDFRLEMSQLRSLRIRGWGVTNFLALLRIFNVSEFPRLLKLHIGGCMIVSPGLTQTKDTSPRPRLKSRPKELCPLDQDSLLEKLSQVLSFHLSPYARYRYTDESHEQYWMGHFNGQLWQPSGFPVLKELRLNVGNFDDASRWIIPMMENCFAFVKTLEVLEIDHTILRPFRQDNPMLKMFRLVKDFPDAFSGLQVVKVKMIESVTLLQAIQSELTQLFNRPIQVKTRKLFLRMADPSALLEMQALKQWSAESGDLPERRMGISRDVESHEVVTTSSSSEDFSCSGLTMDTGKFTLLEEKTGGRIWCEEDAYGYQGVSDHHPFNDACSSMLILNFESHNPEAENPIRILGSNWINPSEYQHSLSYPQVAKILLKHFTPSNTVHSSLLLSMKFNASRKVLPLRRLTVQLDLPQIWQLSEEAAKAAVTAEIRQLRRIIVDHPDLKDAAEIRVMSCTRLTYGGSNWNWWEHLICGDIRKHSSNDNSQGWAREVPAILPRQRLKVFQCNHVS